MTGCFLFILIFYFFLLKKKKPVFLQVNSFFSQFLCACFSRNRCFFLSVRMKSIFSFFLVLRASASCYSAAKITSLNMHLLCTYVHTSKAINVFIRGYNARLRYVTSISPSFVTPLNTKAEKVQNNIDDIKIFQRSEANRILGAARLYPSPFSRGFFFSINQLFSIF